MDALRTRDATAPRLTWYGPDAERIELSGRVLENWVAKTANFLVDELDAGPGTVVALRLPVHWRSLVWLLAGWTVGAGVALPDTATDDDGGAPAGASGADIVVTDTPGDVPSGPLVVAVALPALAMRWPGDLPRGVLDYAGEVRAHSDVYQSFGSGGTEPLEALVPGLGAAETGRRLLVPGSDGWAAVVRASVGAWVGGGSIVLLDAGVAATDRLRESERV